MSFKPAPFPTAEEGRVSEVEALAVMGTDQKQSYYDYVSLAAELANCRLSVINIIDSSTQWSLCGFGLPDEVFQTIRSAPREMTICQYALLSHKPTIIDDLEKDTLFNDHPMVTNEPYIRFYAGFPLISKRGNVMGTLCLIDYEPQHIEAGLIGVFEKLARRVAHQLELSKEKVNQDVEYLTNILARVGNKFNGLTVDELLFCLNFRESEGTLQLKADLKQKLLASGIIERSGAEIIFSKDWTAVKEEIFESRKNRRVVKIDESYLDNQIQLIENM